MLQQQFVIIFLMFHIFLIKRWGKIKRFNNNNNNNKNIKWHFRLSSQKSPWTEYQSFATCDWFSFSLSFYILSLVSWSFYWEISNCKGSWELLTFWLTWVCWLNLDVNLLGSPKLLMKIKFKAYFEDYFEIKIYFTRTDNFEMY